MTAPLGVRAVAAVLTMLIRGVMWCAPSEFSQRFGGEIRDSARQGALAVGRTQGVAAEMRVAWRTLLDLIGVTWRERSAGRAGDAGGAAWSDMRGDLRYALRGWRRAPGFSITIVVTVALALGLTSAIFSFADGYLFRPLPFPGGDRAYYVRDPNGKIAKSLMATDTVALRNSALAHFGFVEWSPGNGGAIRFGDREISSWEYQVTTGFRQTLPLRLIIGRDFTPEDHREGAPVVAWLSHRFWVKEFGSDPGVVGRTFPFAAFGGVKQIHIVGVLGPEVASFDLNNEPPDIVTAFRGPARVGPNRLSFPIIRLPDGMTEAAAIEQIASTLQAFAPGAAGTPRMVTLRPLRDAQVAGGAPTARLLFVGAMLVFVLATLSLVHLLLGRAASRRREVITRLALGATRWRVTRVFMVESALTGAAGIAFGLGIGYLLSMCIESQVPRFPTAGRNLSLVPMMFDARVIAFASGLGSLLVALGGWWPARQAYRHSVVRKGGLQPRTSPRGRLSRGLLVSELTVATVIMVGTVYIGHGIYRHLNQPLGFEYAGRLNVDLQGADGGTLTGVSASAVADQFRRVAGVKAVGARSTGVPGGDKVVVPGLIVDTADVQTQAMQIGYYEARGLKLRSGRWFGTAEFREREGVAVVDEVFARKAWPGRSAVGERLIAGQGVERTVIGVVEAVVGQLNTAPKGSVYVPADARASRGWILVQTEPDRPDVAAELTRVVAQAQPGATAVVTPETFETLFMRGVGEAQFQRPIVAAFGVLAFILAGIAVSGLVSHEVQRRAREFGIRLALGAGTAQVWRAVMREAIVPALIGLVIGSGLALGLESVLQSSVFGWKSSGPTAVVIVAIGLLAVAVVAALVPAARATRIDPATTLRAE